MAEDKKLAAEERAKHEAALEKARLERIQQEEAAKQAEAAQKAAEEAENQAKARKAALEEQIRQKELVAQLAEQAAQEAQEKKRKAQEKAAEWKRLAAEQAAKSAAEIAAAEKAARDRQAELEAERKRKKAQHDAALAAQAETFRLASLAAEEAHAAAEAARRAREEEQIAAHKRQMAARRSAFEKAFRNVWATGSTGVSMAHLTVPAHAGELISRLFTKTLAADVTDVVQQVKKTWLNHGHVKSDETRHLVKFVSSDDRIAEAIEEVAAFMAGSHEPIPFDMVVTPLATGSKDYIEWVKTQTLKKDDSTAFFNQQADPAMEALTSRVA